MQKTIKSGKSHLTIDTQGGKIVELVLQGKKILGTYQRVDGKVGATHICTPNFAGEGMTEFGLPFHGPARTLEWEVVKESENMIEIKVVLEALEKYKSALEVRQIFRLDSSHSFRMTENESKKSTVMLSLPKHPEKMFFHHEVSVKNIGEYAVPVNIGIHNYFDTPNGWQEAKINGKNIKEEIEKNLSIPIAVMVSPPGVDPYGRSLPNHDMSPIPFDKLRVNSIQAQGDKFRQHIEAISDDISRHPGKVQDQTSNLSDSGVAPLPRMTNGSNTNYPTTWNLEFACPDSVGGTRLSRYNRGNLFRIATQGASEMVTWSAVKDGKYDDKYACIEPVCWFDTKFFGTPPSLLKPGEARILAQRISVL